MTISHFTRQVCRRLCHERYVEMELARLDRKAAILHERSLTETEARIDAEDREASLRMLAAAREVDPRC